MCPRYGRVYKRANLDILEQNVISRMSNSLQQLNVRLSGTDPAEETVSQRIAKLSSDDAPFDEKRRRKMANKQKSLLDKARDAGLVPWDHFGPSMTDTLPLVKGEVREWTSAVLPLLHIYRDLTKVARERSAHVGAWEAAFAFTYRTELERVRQSPSASQHQQAIAMRLAKIQAGAPPRAEKQFATEAMLMSIHTRFKLCRLAEQWMSSIPADCVNRKTIWAAFVSFINTSCCQDAELALKTAIEADSLRLAMRCAAMKMKATFEKSRFITGMSQRTLGSDARQQLVEHIKRQLSAEEEEYAGLVRSHGQVSEIQTNLVQPGKAILDEWAALVRSIEGWTFYQPVTLKERTFVARSLGGTSPYISSEVTALTCTSLRALVCLSEWAHIHYH